MADNSPAWVLHGLLMSRSLTSYEDFRNSMITIPCHMFDIKRRVSLSINEFDWYVAHLYPAKNRDTNWLAWSRAEVQRRFYLTLHPCNLFPVPGARNREQGEDPAVISFAAGRYAERYGPIWDEFVNFAGGEQIPSSSDFVVSARLPRQASRLERPQVISTTNAGALASAARVRYTATRLLFRKHEIKSLKPDESFEVDTPDGVFQFTKHEFYTEFPGVARSRSYAVGGVYHYPKIPERAKRFRVG